MALILPVEGKRRKDSRRNAPYARYEKDRDGSLEKGKKAPRKVQLTLLQNQSQIFHRDMVLILTT